MDNFLNYNENGLCDINRKAENHSQLYSLSHSYNECIETTCYTVCLLTTNISY